MELYESLFIIRPSLSDEETTALIEKMKGTVTKNGASLERAENWGRKKLAYEIKRERKGTYVYFYFKGPGAVIAELERSYRLEDSIIKFLTVKLEQEPAPPRGAPVPAPQGATVGGVQQSYSGRESDPQPRAALYAERDTGRQFRFGD